MSAQVFQRATVRRSVEFERVRALPRRTWEPAQIAQWREYLHKRLRLPGATMQLRDIQTIALAEISTVGGLLGPIPVGEGKTLISLLAPRLVNAVRPVLILPAALVEKTKRESGTLGMQWDIPANIQIESYELLGRESASKLLEIAAPDWLIFDEAHRLKNKRAGVTRRVRRYLDTHNTCRVVAMSGTLIRDSIKDFAHIAVWALREGAPVPRDVAEAGEWSDALGVQRNPLRQWDPGPLAELAPVAESWDRTEMARNAFRARLAVTPGVVASQGAGVACSIRLTQVSFPVSRATETNFDTLRGLWETPDGWTLSQAVDIWRHSQELALGFHYIWDPRPPVEWLQARKAWAAFVRETLAHSQRYDTEGQLASAVAAGHVHSDAFTVWRNIADTFKANQKAIWHDDSALLACAAWAKEGPGIIWTEHAFFGRTIAHKLGLRYFGEGGADAHGPIEGADANSVIVASGDANGTGRNLQKWARNLITSPMTGSDAWEQRIGRTHRPGQGADEVTFDVLCLCRENYEALEKALEAARMIAQTTGASQKLLLADIEWPDIRTGAARWIK